MLHTLTIEPKINSIHLSLKNINISVMYGIQTNLMRHLILLYNLTNIVSLELVFHLYAHINSKPLNTLLIFSWIVSRC